MRRNIKTANRRLCSDELGYRKIEQKFSCEPPKNFDINGQKEYKNGLKQGKRACKLPSWINNENKMLFKAKNEIEINIIVKDKNSLGFEYLIVYLEVSPW